MRLQLVNAGEASYAAAYGGYRACASYDMQDWFRGVLTISHSPEHDAVQYAYFAPYSLDRAATLLARTLGRSRPDALVRLQVLGRTLDGRDLELLRPPGSAPPLAADPAAVSTPPSTSAGSCDGALRIWIIARQHPGESMAEWFAEGLVERLTDPEDGIAHSLLGRATFFVVRNINPDGSFRGHLRTNAAGTNLNRAWAAPSLDSSPEVFHTLRAIEKEGVDMFVDVHGDEDLPHVFIAGLEGIPRWDSRLAGLQAAFCDAFGRHAPEFQATRGYGADKPGSANLTVASKQIGQRFACLSVTLEMPFKDCAELPNERVGWSPGRSKRLGAALLGAVNDILHMLR
ncbi:hypothetical protein TSOC_008101 [Tetrabaena socialis]|uniref:Peptidase M14 domain-containing protein n=1 Tax=Tetrabaena socialis TaxID=47790 RepID=A0A2J7ZZD4_9CHLO|nr:hypothetical protein TSOC_008101 [Tetrabaena socialis]|eukprot:PNH05606.1 hypothetical protein TSOC_008101 [Tetrabaena socialis]